MKEPLCCWQAAQMEDDASSHLHGMDGWFSDPLLGEKAACLIRARIVYTGVETFSREYMAP